MEGLEVDILEKIKITRSKDKEMVKVVEEMKKAEVKCYGTLWTITFFFFLLSIFLNFIFLFF